MDITITASVVAWYAAIVSTLSFTMSTYVALRDRPRLRITARSNFQMLGDTEHQSNKLYICINVANRGRRAVTVDAVGLIMKGKDQGDFLLSDSVRQGPKEVTEGKSVTYMADQSLVDQEKISHVMVRDQSGRIWKGKFLRPKAD